MRIVLLTTPTNHHLYFAQKVMECFPFDAIFLETIHKNPSFRTAHPFEIERDDYESGVLLEGCVSQFDELAPTCLLESLNDSQCVIRLQQYAPELIIVFGTGKLRLPIIQTAAIACLNLHGGNPEEYRGLDTHLWAVYHQDFVNLITTLHHMDTELDTGDIVLQSSLPLSKDCYLYMLRSLNTKICVDMTKIALTSLDMTGRLPSRRQMKRGRYYSFMPSVLKEICVIRFSEYVRGL
jgi:methionyl-tRNA formyltransferase